MTLAIQQGQGVTNSQRIIPDERLLAEIKSGYNFINGNYNNFNLDRVNQNGNGRFSVDANTAFQFFNLMQLDNGIAGPKNNGSNFSVNVIKQELQKIKDELKSGNLNTMDKQILHIQKGMLRKILKANTDGNKYVSQKEMRAILDDNGNFKFGSKLLYTNA